MNSFYDALSVAFEVDPQQTAGSVTVDHFDGHTPSSSLVAFTASVPCRPPVAGSLSFPCRADAGVRLARQ